MPQTETVKLTSPPLVQSGSRSGGGCLLAFGLPFVAIGAYLAWLLYAHRERIAFEEPRMPDPFVYCFCAAFVGAGLKVWADGLSAILQNWRTDRGLRARPREPWLGDHPWNPEGARQRPWLAALRGLVAFAWLVAFLAPFHWWMTAVPWLRGQLILGLFDAIFLGLALVWLFRLARSIRHGAGWVRFDRFPFFLGENLDVRLGCGGRLDRFERLTVTVRFVHVKKEQRGSSRAAVAYQHWAEQLVFEPSRLQDPHVLPVSLALPGGDLGTWLSLEPPRYWEIETKGSGPGLHFESRFLVPVYAKPART